MAVLVDAMHVAVTGHSAMGTDVVGDAILLLISIA